MWPVAGTATGLSRTARAAQSRATSVEVMCGLAGRHPFAILSVESPGLGSVVGVAMSQLFEAAGKVSFGDGVITPTVFASCAGAYTLLRRASLPHHGEVESSFVPAPSWPPPRLQGTRRRPYVTSPTRGKSGDPPPESAPFRSVRGWRVVNPTRHLARSWIPSPGAHQLRVVAPR
jgi:hypothetical protein